MRLTFFKENYWPSNDNLYKETKQTGWSVKITRRRLTFFGHVCHLPETIPVKITLPEALRLSKNQEEDTKTTYLEVIKTQLKEKHFQTLDDAMMEAKYREKWGAVIQDPSFLEDKGQQ